MTIRLALLILVSLTSSSLPGVHDAIAQQTVTPTVVKKYRSEAIDKWEEDIQQLESLDKPGNASDNILFIGSSSIRLWETIEQDIQPYSPIRRGYGGAKFTDLAVFAKRLIEPQQYKALVVFVGNDIQGNVQDTPLNDFEELARYVVSVSRAHQPDATVFFIEITPTPARIDAWPKIRKANAVLREVALTEPNTYFIATAEYYLDTDKQPRVDLFRDDRLHQNKTGYDLWASIIKRSLGKFLAKNTEY